MLCSSVVVQGWLKGKGVIGAPVACGGSQVQGGVAALVLGLQVGPLCQYALHHPQLPVLGCPVQGLLPLLRPHAPNPLTS